MVPLLLTKQLSLVTGKTLAENAKTFLPLANGQVWWLILKLALFFVY